MNNEEGKIWLGIGLDTNQLKNDVQTANSYLRTIGGNAEKESLRIESSFRKMGNTIATVFSIREAALFAKQIADIRGEFQMLDVAFRTILQSKDKADSLMAQLKGSALTTPFTLLDLANGAKQLIAYGFAAEDVNDTLVRLGNIASGLGLPLERLTYLYGTTMVQGRLYARDMMQFTTSGIPLLQGLADMYKVSTDKINDMVTAGKIGFPQVKAVLEQLTNSGGKFYNLMEEQSKTIPGQLSNLKDSFNFMLNDLGKGSQDAITGAISLTRTLINNYEMIGKVLVGLIATYGTYKAAVITVNALERLSGELKLQSALAGTTLSTSNGLLSVATASLSRATGALNKTMLANPYVLVTTLVVAAGAAMFVFAENTNYTEQAQNKLNDSLKFQASLMDDATEKAKKYVDIIKDDASTQFDKQRALLALQKLMPTIFKNMDIEAIKLANLVELSKQYAHWRNQGEMIGAQANVVLRQKELNKLQGIDSRLGSNDGGKKVIEEQIEQKKEELRIAQDYFDKLAGMQQDADRKSRSFSQKQFLKAQSEELFKEINQMEKDQKDAVAQNTFYAFGSILEYKKNQYNLLQKEYKALSKETPMKNISEETQAAADKVKQLKKEIKDLRSGKTTSSDYAGDIKSKSEELDEWTKKYETLTGLDKKTLKAAQTAQEKANAQAVAMNNRLLKIKEGEKKVEEMVTQSELDITDASINAMEDGYAKQQRRIDFNYQKSLLDTKKKVNDLVKAQQEQEKLAWENENPDWIKKGKKFKPTTVSLETLPEDQKKIIQQSMDAARMQMVKETSNLVEELTNKYQDYAAQRVKIEEDFDKDIRTIYRERELAQARGDDQSVQKLTANLAKAQTEKGKAIMNLSFEKLKESPDYVRAFEDLDNTSTETLKNLLQRLNEAKLRAAEVLNPSDLKDYTTAIKNILDELTRRNPFQALIDKKQEAVVAEGELNRALENLSRVKQGGEVVFTSKYDSKSGKIKNTYLTEQQAITNVNNAKDKYNKKNKEVVTAEKAIIAQISELSTALQGLGTTLGGSAGEIISLIGDVSSFVTTAGNGIIAVSQKGAQALSTIEKASVILQIVNAAIQLMRKLNEIMPNAHAEYEKYDAKIEEINKMTDAVNAYKLAVREAAMEEDSWFSEDKLSNLKDYKDMQNQIFENYFAKLNEAQATYKNEGGGGWLTSAGNLFSGQWFVDTVFGTNLTGGNYKESVSKAINNLRIEVRKASSGFLGTGIGGKSQKTEDLVTWVKQNLNIDLFDSDGWLNKEAAQTILDKYGDKLVGQTKETLEELLALRKQYDEYIAKLQEYVSNLYSPLVDNMVSAIWDWFDEGKDALDSFKDYAADTFRDIVSDMLKTIVLKDVVGSYSDEISDLYEQYAAGKITEQELAQLVAEKTNSLMMKYDASLPALETITQTIAKGLKDATGIDIANASSAQSSSSKSVTTASQDSVDEFNGRLTAMNEHLVELVKGFTILIGVSNSILEKVTGIKDDTAKLSSIETNIGKVKEGIDSIVSNGLTLKR